MATAFSRAGHPSVATVAGEAEVRKAGASVVAQERKIVRARGEIVGASAMLTQTTRIDDTVVTHALQVAVLSRQVLHCALCDTQSCGTGNGARTVFAAIAGAARRKWVPLTATVAR